MLLGDVFSLQSIQFVFERDKLVVSMDENPSHDRERLAAGYAAFIGKSEAHYRVTLQRSATKG